jgi:hypothetical protein
MNRIPVVSSNIKSLGHDPDSKTLEVEFHDGAVHRYHGVDHERFKNLLHAPSVGKHFHANIKGKYDHHKVE